MLFVFSIGPSHNQDIELNIGNKRPFTVFQFCIAVPRVRGSPVFGEIPIHDGLSGGRE